MRLRTLLKITGLILAFGLPAMAANQTTETWKAKWPGGSCTLILSYSTDDMAGSVKVVKPCGKTLRKVKSFVYTDESREEMILFARKGARGPIIGSFERTGRNDMDGIIGDGDPTEMFMSASSSVTINTGASSGSNMGSGNIQSCTIYSDSRQCARNADLKNPKIPTFKTVNMLSLADQNIFPFSGGKGFARDESAQWGACMVVKKCERAFNSTEDWCEVVLSDGFFTGWVKRMDDDFVYLRKGC